ncbi:MAG: outer membrane lipoprotein-sorting protein [Candidatus Acidiferrum sp.]
MTLRKIGWCVLLTLLCSVISGVGTLGRTQNPGKITLEYVLSMMDHAALDFRSLTAAIEHVKYTAVVKDTSSETGEIFVRKDAKVRIDFQSPDPRTILRNGDNLYIYTPKINRVEEYNIGKNRAMVDQYLALGFGTRTANLEKNYEIAMTGEEELEGRKAVTLELTPKSSEQRKQISKVVVWVDESSWLPIQEKFIEAGTGDYVLTRYTKVMKNLKLGDGKFKPDWPKGTKVEKPRG